MKFRYQMTTSLVIHWIEFILRNIFCFKMTSPQSDINYFVTCFTHLFFTTKEVISAKFCPTKKIWWLNSVSMRSGWLEIYLAMLSLATLDISFESFILFRQCHADNILERCGGTILLAYFAFVEIYAKGQDEFRATPH